MLRVLLRAGRGLLRVASPRACNTQHGEIIEPPLLAQGGVVLHAANTFLGGERGNKRMVCPNEKAVLLGCRNQSLLFDSSFFGCCDSLAVCDERVSLAQLRLVTGRFFPFSFHKANTSSPVKVEGGIGVMKELVKGSYFMLVPYLVIAGREMPPGA